MIGNALETVESLQAEIARLNALIREYRAQELELSERLQALKLGKPIGTVFATERRVGYGANAKIRPERWRLVRFNPHGPIFQLIKKDGTDGVRFGGSSDIGRVTRIEPPEPGALVPTTEKP